MTALELIARLKERGIRIAARDGELELDAPKGALDDELRAELVRSKPELLRLLAWSRRSGRELPLARVERSANMPLSWAQQRLWFLDQLEPGSSAYNISWTVRLKGQLDEMALQSAFDQLAERHETLRTRFPNEHGQPVQFIDRYANVRLQQEDLLRVSNEHLRARLGKLAAQPFSLADGPLWRVNLIRLNEHEHILLVVIHHIVSDGASMRVLFREVAAYYEARLTGTVAELAELPVQYADYSVWQRQWLDSEELERQTDYWLEQLGGLPPLLELPWDRPRSAAMRYRGASVLHVLSPELAEELRSLGRARGSTLFMVMLTAFYVLLMRYSGRDDLVVGTPMGGRPRSDLEGLIGFFINTVVLRADLGGDPTFEQLLRSVRDLALAAHANQELPFEKLVETLQPQRELSYSPVFQVMFDLQEEPRWKLPVKNLEVIPEVVFSSRTSSFDLTLSVRQAENGLDAMFEYDTDLFDEASIERFATHYQYLLEQIVASPELSISRYSLLNPEEQLALVARWAEPAADYPSVLTLAGLVEAQVGLHPDASALIHGEESLSYSELNRRANRLAHRLQAAGVEVGMPVAVLAERVPETFVAMLGIIKAGGCVLPLDSAYPLERLQFMLGDAGAQQLLHAPGAAAAVALRLAAVCDVHLTELATAVLDSPDYPDSNPFSLAAPDHPAFLMYTSGTTGQPKGVAIAHRGLSNYIYQLGARTGLQSGDRVLQFASLSFDISIEEIFSAWMAGATLVLREAGMNLSAQEFMAGCERYSISWISLPTAWWHELCASFASEQLTLPPALRSVIIGGERARLPAFAIWKQHARGVRLFNTYGPTEASIAVTWCELTNLDPDVCGELPIGHPLPNVFAWVLDEHLQPVPAGVPGELYVGGVGVAQGYWQRPALTAECFVPDPFSHVDGALLYRTGDRARYLADGRLVYLGRIDEQVKIRGHRIEPAEVEAVLLAFDGVDSCAVAPHLAGTQENQDVRLVGYVVGNLSSSELRARAAEQLPEYMVPSVFIAVPKIPLTVNGKLDKRALPEPEWLRDEAQLFIAPRNEAEFSIASIWSDVLGIESIGIHDDFFALGGHSLLATRVISRIRDAVNTDVPLRDLFAAPTVAGLAAALTRLAENSYALPLIEQARTGALLPLSWAQERLWVLDQLEENSATYNMPWAARLTGSPDVNALQLAVDDLVGRHESLRTGFAEHDGEPVQLIATGVSVSVKQESLVNVDAQQVQERLQQLIAVPFDLSSPPLLRVTLLHTGDSEYILLLLLHHIVADGWSMGILLRDLTQFYARATGRTDAVVEQLPVQYADYAIWQRDWLQRPEMRQQETYWAEQLLDMPPVLELPLDYPRPPVQANRGGWEGRQLSRELLDKLQALAAAGGATMFMVSLAVFKAMLAVQTGREDIVVGTPIAGRRHTETENLIGCFLNTLTLRTSLAANPEFMDLLERVKQTTLDAYDHQDLPFEKLLELLQPERSASYSPVVQVMFNLHNAPAGALALGDIDIESLDLERGTAKFDLSAVLIERKQGLYVGFEYNTDIFAVQTVQKLLQDYVLMLERVVADQHVVLADLVRTQVPRIPALCETWSRGTSRPEDPLPTATDDAESGADIYQRFAEVANRFPDRLAVADGLQSWTYSELRSQANVVARELVEAGAGHGANVGLLLGQDAPMVAGLLGVLQAGCVYVPLDSKAPAARLKAVVADAELVAVVTDNKQADLLAAMELQDVPRIAVPVELVGDARGVQRSATPDSLAYILFTSGSTGKPKGVMQTHRNVLHHAQTYTKALDIIAEDRLTLLPHYGFDAAVMDIFAALLSGACLRPMDILETASAGDLLNTIRDEQLSVLHATPTVFRYLLSTECKPASFAGVRAVVLGGEVARSSDLDLFRQNFSTDTLFINGLGPSESTTALQFFADHETRLSGMTVPVGLPVNGTSIRVLDSTGRESGIAGELCLGSDWVSPGYWALPELTATRFMSDPTDSNQRLYKTGDKVRYRPDGQLVFVGRLDEQLKVRGHRIEPAEVEAALKRIDGVERAAVVVASPDNDDEALLLAYVQGVTDTSGLPAVLRELLPGYMVPARYISVDEWPLLANGKLNLRALPQPDWHAVGGRVTALPQSETEQGLARIWCDVLGTDVIGIDDDFFALGGHSLNATRVVARVRDSFGVELSLRDLFSQPTIFALASAIDSAHVRQGRPVLEPQSAGVLPPLSWAQQRLWFLDQLDPESAAYSLHWAAKLEGTVQLESLQTAVNLLVARHGSLRTTFGGDDGRPVQLVAPVTTIPVQREALIGVSAERLHSRLLDLIRQPFNLQSGPLFRVYLLEHSERESTLLLLMHHIVSDGWSMGILFRELAALYQSSLNGAAPDLPDLPVQYADYAVWQRAWLSGGELERQEEYWREKLLNAPPLLELPLDHARPPVQRFRGAWVSDVISAEITNKLQTLASAQRATLFMVLLAAFKVVIARHTGREDVLIGTPIAGRRRTELEGLVGFFLNTLVLRTDLAGNPDFSHVLDRVRETTLGAYDHQELPFEKLLEILQPVRSTAYTPVVQVMFNLHNEPGGTAGLQGVNVTPFAIDRGTAKFDLSVAIVESASGLQVGFEYNTDLFERATVQLLQQHFFDVLSAVASSPQLNVAALQLSDSVCEPRPQQAFEPFEVNESGHTLLERFDLMVERFAERPAVDDFEQSWNYAELSSYANAVGSRVAAVTQSNSRVGLLLGHDARMVAGLLGVLRAGCAYVPLDPSSPPARIKAIIEDAGLVAVVTDRQHRDVLHAAVNGAVAVVEVPEELDTEVQGPERSSTPNDLAYILFTSGSTGTPKGVMQSHRNVLHHARTYINALHVNEQDRLSLFSSYGFDASVMDIFGALLSGACLCPVDIRAYSHPGDLLDQIGLDETEGAQEGSPGVTVLHTTPTVFRFLMRHKVCRHELTGTRLVVLGGEEALAADFVLFKRHFAPPALFVNGLGPSESTTAAQFFADHNTRLPGQIVPVGSAVSDTALMVLNESGDAAGITGELAICSAYVGTGYWNQPELSKQKFIAAPSAENPDRVMYRTGDRVRLLPDGRFAYLGRIDGQVKIRGHRIEPGEIESHLLALEGVDRCSVMARADALDGGKSEARLVAYVVVQSDVYQEKLSSDALRRTLKSVLPDYMVPQAIVFLDDLPLMPNGKVDRKALPAPDWTRDESQTYVEPRTDTERRLASIWSEILGVGNVSVFDDFFELGGHSLMAAQLVARVTESMQVGLPLRRLFDTPTVAGLAEHVETLQWALQVQTEPDESGSVK